MIEKSIDHIEVQLNLKKVIQSAAASVAAINRRQGATEKIWRELSDRLRQFVQSRIKTAEDVDDILQTVFLLIHSQLDELRKAARLKSWVFQIACNCGQNMTPTAQRKPTCSGYAALFSSTKAAPWIDSQDPGLALN